MDEEDEFEPLFDYHRQAPCVIPLKDGHEEEDVVVVESPSACDTKRKAQTKPGPMKQDSEKSPMNRKNTKNVDMDDDESWLAPPPKLAKRVTTNSANMALRVRSAELMSMTEKASRDVQELFAKQERAAIARRHHAGDGKVEVEKESEKESQKILIKVQDKSGATQSFRLGTNDMFQKLFTAYANFVEKPLANLVFRFDGETVHANSTPASLDLEDEDIIEVFIRSNTGH